MKSGSRAEQDARRTGGGHSCGEPPFMMAQTDAPNTMLPAGPKPTRKPMPIASPIIPNGAYSLMSLHRTISSSSLRSAVFNLRSCFLNLFILLPIFRTALADAFRPSELKVPGVSPKLELSRDQQGCIAAMLFVRVGKAGPLWFGYLCFPRFSNNSTRRTLRPCVESKEKPSQARYESIVNMDSAAHWVAQ